MKVRSAAHRPRRYRRVLLRGGIRDHHGACCLRWVTLRRGNEVWGFTACDMPTALRREARRQRMN